VFYEQLLLVTETISNNWTVNNEFGKDLETNKLRSKPNERPPLLGEVSANFCG
jgi:hypothetical protein